MNTNIDKLKDITGSFFSFPRIDSNLTAWFLFEGKEYEIGRFNIGFNQLIDYKGQPQNEVHGGRFAIILTEAVPENIYQWAIESSLRNGVIKFRSKTTSSPLTVEFKNAYCVNFEREINSKTGLKTAMVIYPEEVIVNGIDFDNNWASNL